MGVKGAKHQNQTHRKVKGKALRKESSSSKLECTPCPKDEATTKQDPLFLAEEG